MNDNSLTQDGEHGSLVQYLVATPIGRRWLLKAGLGSAAALAAASSPLVTAASPLAQASGTPTAKPSTASQPSRARDASTGVTLHFAPVSATSTMTAGGVADLQLIANGAALPLLAHTATSRTALKPRGGLWAAMNVEALTHYVDDVPVPSDRAMSVSVSGLRGNTEVLVSQMVYTPPDATRALAQRPLGQRLCTPWSVPGSASGRSA